MNRVIGRGIAISLLLLGCADGVRTQPAATLTGRITDPQDAVVPGAIVRLHAREGTMLMTAVTDTSGIYRFGPLQAGEYLIVAEAPGFARFGARDVFVQRNSTTTFDISLRLAEVRTEVVVTASSTLQRVDEVSKAIAVVGAQEIEERDEFAISEALRTTPGLRVQQLGGPGTLTSIKTRGLRNQDTAVLIDGLRLRDAAAPQGDATAFISDLIVTDINRIEVLRGSGSSLYGTNAIGGVINIVTEEGGGPVHGNLLLEGGALGMFRAHAQVAGGSRTDRALYSTGLTHLNVTRGVDGHDAARDTSVQGRLVLRLTPTAMLSGRVIATDAFVQLNESPDVIPAALPPVGIVRAVPLALAELHRLEAGTPLGRLNTGAATFIPSANDPDSRQASRLFSGALSFADHPTTAFGYTVSYQGLTTNRTNRNGPAGRTFQPIGGNTESDYDGSIHTLNARADVRLGHANFITAGYEFENESFQNRSSPVPPEAKSLVVVSQRSHAIFAQDQVRLLDDSLQLSAAVRAQFFSLARPEFAPAGNAPFQRISFVAPPDAYTGDGSIAYFFRSSNTKVRAHVGNGYRAPSLFERFGTFFDSFSNSFSPLGDPRLRPERSIAVDAGLDQALYRNRMRLSTTYFYTRLQEVIAFGPVGRNDPFGRIFGGYTNTIGGLARGVELSATAAPTRALDVFASYTYTNTDQRAPQLGDVIRSFIIPNHQFSFVATEHIGRRWLLNFDLVATSDYLAPIFSSDFTIPSRVYRFDGLVKADFGTSYTRSLGEPRSLRFFGKVENLSGHENFESGFRTAGRVGVIGVAFKF